MKLDLVVVRDNVVRDLLGMAMRQGLLALMGGVLFAALRVDLPAGLPEGIAAGIVLLSTAAYGQIKAYYTNKRALGEGESLTLSVGGKA